jgi:hypothetical protein
LDHEAGVEYCSLGIQDRDLEYEEKQQASYCLLALSSEVKVGVTRKHKYLRWIDQGAIEAVSIVEVPNRYLAGITEVALKNIMLIKLIGEKC